MGRTAGLLVLGMVLMSFLPLAQAENQLEAHVFVTVLNPVPVLENITVTSPAYPFRDIACIGEAIDNSPESVTLKYDWYVDEKLVSHESELSDAPPGSKVKCEITAYDSAGQASNTLSASVAVEQLTVLGITGYAVNTALSGNGVAAGALLFVSAVMVFSYSRHRKKKIMFKHHKL